MNAYERACRLAWRGIVTVAIVAGVLFLVRWALTEYWITTHCTVVLGTRVCK